ncbi:MAG: tetratricopeptide repeat protein [Bacteroidetes bacterium]|nr:tetratricopeptide repeat protein [Bacteroidota bacterium]
MRNKLFIIGLLLTTLIGHSQDSPVIKNLLVKLKKNKAEDTVRANTLNNLAWEYSFFDFETSSDYARRAVSLSKKIGYEDGKGEAFNVLGNNARAKNQNDSAYYFLNNALEIRKSQGKEEKVSAVLINIANIFYQQKDYPNAILKYNEAIKMAESIKFYKGSLVALTNLADAYGAAGLYQKALQTLNRALGLNKSVKDSLQEPYLYSTMATLLQEMNEIPAAVLNAKKALSMLDKHPDVFLKIALLNNLGAYERDLGNNDTSLVILNTALILEEQNNDSSGLATTHNAIAMTYLLKEQPDFCISFAGKARITAGNIHDTVSYYNAVLILADAYQQKRDFKKALTLALEAEPYVKAINNKKSLYEMYDTFSGIYEGLNQQDKRAEALEKIILYRDSVLSDENKKLSARMNVELNLYGKEKEIELLNKSAEVKEVELSKQKAARSFITGIACLFGLVVLIIIFFYIKIRKSNLVINKQKERVESQNEIILNQKHLVEEKQKEIIDSINYARRIQSAVLTGDDVWTKVSKEHFVFFKPKDIVSGDFYWAYNTPNNRSVFALADCTGHGVPGGFMSMLGNSFLNEIVIENKIFSAPVILNKLREKIINALEQKGEEKRKDGMDIALCVWNKLNNTLEFAGANNGMILIRDNTITELKPDKMPIGSFINDERLFTSQTVQLQTGDCIYLTTDGFPDQFGGPKGKKFKYRQTEQLLLSIHKMPFTEQGKIIEEKFIAWQGNLEQIDDVSLLGICV